MRSICVVLAAAGVILVLDRLSWASSSSKAAAAAADTNNKELERKYNKIFSDSLFALDPKTTRQWLKQLYHQLEYDPEDKYGDKVKKLLAFDDIDCDLTKGSGEKIVAYYRFFTSASNSTLAVRMYIANCLARMYEKCKESFVARTEKAVGRIESNESNVYERMVRLKELIANKSDLRTPVVEFLLQQTKKYPTNKYEFEDQFKRHISGPCKTVRRQLDLMIYFEVLLTKEQIESMGENVRQWHIVSCVCMWALEDDDDDKQIPHFEALFKHMTFMIEREDSIVDKNYQRVFQAEPALPLKAEETYEQLVWLSEKLQKQGKRKEWDRNTVSRLSKVMKWLELGQFWRNKQCDMNGTVKQVNEYLFKANKSKYTFAINTYLRHLRDQAFELCRSDVAKLVAGSVQRLAQNPKWKEIFRLHELVAKMCDGTSRRRWSKLVFGLVDEQTGSAPLSPELNSRDESYRQLSSLVMQHCERIRHEFRYFWDVDNIWRLEVADQMDPTARYWFLTFKICSHQYLIPRQESTRLQRASTSASRGGGGQSRA